MSGTGPDIGQLPPGSTKLNSWFWKVIKAVIRLRHEARCRKKFALLIGIGYTNSSDSWQLSGIEKDLSAVEDLLIKHYGYKKKNIVILSDQHRQGVCFDPHFLPTQNNIMREVKRLVRSSVQADYFVMFSGHSGNRKDPETPSKEWDDMEEYMIPCDAPQAVEGEGEEDQLDESKVITDKVLNYWLVDRLRSAEGSRLFSILDCCHSGTLLNLIHRRCHEEGNSVKSRVRRLIRQAVVEPIYRNLMRTGYFPQIKLNYMKLGREGTECLGLCCPTRHPTTSQIQPQVVCISACTDAQSVVNVGRGGVLIQKFVEVMGSKNKDRLTTYRQLMASLRDGSRQAAIFAIQNHKLAESLWLRFQQKRSVRSDPQLSSDEPLNLDLKIEL